MKESHNKREAHIPDDDVMGWIRILQEGGFSNQEIDRVLKLNQSYAEKLLPVDTRDRFKTELQRLERQHGKKLTEEERKGLLDRFQWRGNT